MRSMSQSCLHRSNVHENDGKTCDEGIGLTLRHCIKRRIKLIVY